MTQKGQKKVFERFLLFYARDWPQGEDNTSHWRRRLVPGDEGGRLVTGDGGGWLVAVEDGGG